LGKKYRNGLSAHKAKLWYLKAANNSHPRAKVAIGDLYNSHTFHCSKRDIQKALDWYLRAHENGNKEAAYIIARLYKTATSIENHK
jgi:TPR repeat protein